MKKSKMIVAVAVCMMATVSASAKKGPDFVKQRHTYATMHVGAFRNAASTALNMGHGHSTDMLEKHYRGLVPKTVAQRYWTIFPKGG